MDGDGLTFTGIVVNGDCCYVSLCTELDVASQGKTVQEAKEALIEAVALYLETALESNLPYLRPIPQEENPLLTDPGKVVESFPVSVRLTVTACA